MELASSDEIKTLLATVIKRLEKTPVEFVEQLVDLLAAPERKRDEQLLRDLLLQIWLLLESPESFAPYSSTKEALNNLVQFPIDMTYERLIRLMCNVIEAEIARQVLLAAEPSFSLGRKSMQIFWGGLAMHIKLALPLGPLQGSTLFSNDMVILKNGKTYPCETPFSESKICELLTHLGRNFVIDYAAAYIHNQQLRCFIDLLRDNAKNTRAVSANNSALLEFVVQERTLNRYVDKFSKRIALHLLDGCKKLPKSDFDAFRSFTSSSSGDSVLSRIMALSTSALFIEHKKYGFLDVAAITRPDVTHPQADTTNAVARLQTFEFLEILDRYKDIQQQAIRDSFHSKNVTPNLQFRTNLDQEPKRITVGELAEPKKHRILIVAPQGGGKTRLLYEILLRASGEQSHHLYVDLAETPAVTFTSFYRLAANYILKRLGQDRAFASNLERNLEILDLHGQITWYIDGLDEFPKVDVPMVLRFIMSLNQYFLSISNPPSIVQILQRNDTAAPGYVDIQPFTSSQIAQFIEANCINDESKKAKLQRRVLQLPGLASIPQGLEYLRSNPRQGTVVDILIGYINSNLQKKNQPLIHSDELLCSRSNEIVWKSVVLESISYLVKAICAVRTRNPSDFWTIQVDEIVPYMGAESKNDNQQLAMERIERALHVGFLRFDADKRTLCFTIPEIGIWFAAIAILSHQDGNRWLDYAMHQFQSNPQRPLNQMLLSLAAWRRENRSLRE